MKIFDFNIHLPDLQTEGIHSLVDSEISATNKSLIERVQSIYPENKIEGANFMIFNPTLFSEGNEFINYCKSTYALASFTLLVDFRSDDCYDDIDKGIEAGINCIKFHSYHQQISAEWYEKIKDICLYAEERNLIICLDASYGTSKMIQYDIIEFICFIADFVSKTPIVALHSGGLKCLSIMLLALEKDNLYVETSASLPFYMDSSIERDLAFMYKKLNPERILWATDAPYFTFNDTLEATTKFFDKHGFSTDAQEKIFYKNSVSLLNF